MLFLIEFLLTAFAIVGAFTFPTLGASSFAKLERLFARLARRRGVAVLTVGLLALGLRLASLPVEPVPEPISHDEWGHLLAADTFAHWRLTNPTHALWVHFESFSIMQQPTYQTYMQPGQGMILALGKIIFGHPYWGVWLSCGLMCAAITWALQAWMPARWALLGGLLAILRYGVFGYWANSYWGGAMGAVGGALVLGALPRIKRSQRVRDALVMALGLGILAHSRPYEGLIFSLPVAAVFLWWIFSRQAPAFQVSFRRVLVPLCLALAIIAAGTCYYFWRLTGSPFTMPYHFSQEGYVAPYMIWQSPRPAPAYHHYVFWKMCVEQAPQMYAIARSPSGLLLKAIWWWPFFLGPVFTFAIVIAIAALPYGFSWRHISKNMRFLLILSAVFVIGLALESPFFPHYAAPSTAIILVFMLQSMRRLQSWHPRGRPAGLFISRAILPICLTMFVLRAVAGPLHIPLTGTIEPAWSQEGPRGFGRTELNLQLQELPRKQLVIVSYTPAHDPLAEWVYNDADIDNSKVVWAREMGELEDRKLVQYFNDRQISLLQADDKPPKLTPYEFLTDKKTEPMMDSNIALKEHDSDAAH
jgi:hypothetical protein